MKLILKNKKVYSNFDIDDKYEAGIQLFGWEVKSVKNAQISLKEAFVVVRNNEAFLINSNISRWKTQSRNELINPMRERKLLLHRYEIDKIEQKLKTKGYTLVVTQVYISNSGKIKVEVGLAKGKKKYDKRQVLKEKDQKRQIERDLKNAGL